MIPATFRRLLSRGDLPDSAGGLYNPGAWQHPVSGRLAMIVRHEADYTWTKPCVPTGVQYVTDNVEALVYPPVTLVPTGFHTGTRVEDFRPFVWEDLILVAHVAYRPHSGEPVYQRLSRLTDGRLERWDDWTLPVPPQPVEKNWVLAAREGELFTVYSLDPLLVFVRDPSLWTLVRHQHTGLTKAFGKPLRNSTHLLPFDGGFLGFYHYICDRQYVTGAYLLDSDFRLAARTGILLDSDGVGPETPGGVYKPGVLYISSAVQRGEEILLFAGVGDAHSDVITVQAEEIRRRLQ